MTKTLKSPEIWQKQLLVHVNRYSHTWDTTKLSRWRNCFDSVFSSRPKNKILKFAELATLARQLARTRLSSIMQKDILNALWLYGVHFWGVVLLKYQKGKSQGTNPVPDVGLTSFVCVVNPVSNLQLQMVVWHKSFESLLKLSEKLTMPGSKTYRYSLLTKESEVKRNHELCMSKKLVGITFCFWNLRNHESWINSFNYLRMYNELLWRTSVVQSDCRWIVDLLVKKKLPTRYHEHSKFPPPTKNKWKGKNEHGTGPATAIGFFFFAISKLFDIVTFHFKFCLFLKFSYLFIVAAKMMLESVNIKGYIRIRSIEENSYICVSARGLTIVIEVCILFLTGFGKLDFRANVLSILYDDN